MNTGDASNAPIERPSAQPHADRRPDGPDAPAQDSASSPAREAYLYHADAFHMPLPSDAWTCGTTYTLLGPVSRGMRHNITVTLDRDVEHATLSDYAAAQMEPLENSLPDCTLLMHGPLPLTSGNDGYRCIYRWHPEDQEQPLYQEQVYVLANGIGYTLTASFRSDTRKRFGAVVEQMMRSFRVRSSGADARRP